MLFKNHSLKQLNTFGVEARADYFMVLGNERPLQEIIKSKKTDLPFFILGGGSNLLFTGNLPCLVIKNEIKGYRFEKQKNHEVIVTAGAGENWHEFVKWCLGNDFGGLENLSLIPGTVGAAPIQNIGAYGVELKDVFFSLSAVHLATGAKRTFTKTDCLFDYRDSIFKKELKGEYCITEVSFKLSSRNHDINGEYGIIRTVLQENGITNPTILDIHNAVVQIRENKLPDPAQLGNAGSFFKNPEIKKQHFEKIKKDYPAAPFYPGSNDLIKVPAGWLIEQCGWKGRKRGQVGCYEKQALILVNYGNATGEEIKQLSDEIAFSVFDKFNIKLHREVNII